jgi:glycosyltransferase involved in cell wall biosynthesis
MRVAIATVQVPFITGGAEALAEGLKAAMVARGHTADIVTLPFRFFPPEEVERSMRVWEGEDFTRLNLYDADRVVCLKFPAYGLKHASKSLWLCHQHRGTYDLFDAEKSTPEERGLKESIAAFDAKHLPAVGPRHTISRRVSERLKQFNGIDSTPVYHPPPMAPDHYTAAAQPYVFFPSRVEHAKRQEMLVRAMKALRGPGYAVFAGEGGQIGAMRALAAKLGVVDRVRFLGRVTREEMLGLYANATAVCFTPLDEDYGYVTLEAMLSSKPVITCTDSGGPLEFVEEGETGHVVAPDPEEIARVLGTLMAQPSRAARMGRAARVRYGKLVPGWNQVVDTLLAGR